MRHGVLPADRRTRPGLHGLARTDVRYQLHFASMAVTVGLVPVCTWVSSGLFTRPTASSTASCTQRFHSLMSVSEEPS